jgi:hypothetical protein
LLNLLKNCSIQIFKSTETYHVKVPSVFFKQKHKTFWGNRHQIARLFTNLSLLEARDRRHYVLVSANEVDISHISVSSWCMYKYLPEREEFSKS